MSWCARIDPWSARQSVLSVGSGLPVEPVQGSYTGIKSSQVKSRRHLFGGGGFGANARPRRNRWAMAPCLVRLVRSRVLLHCVGFCLVHVIPYLILVSLTNCRPNVRQTVFLFPFEGNVNGRHGFGADKEAGGFRSLAASHPEVGPRNLGVPHLPPQPLSTILGSVVVWCCQVITSDFH